MLSLFKQVIKNNHRLRKLTYLVKDFCIAIKYHFLKKEPDEYWRNRTEDALRCLDNTKIQKVQDAGKVNFFTQTMHNGLKVKIGTYYGTGASLYGAHYLFKINKGVHEPQEEYIFQEVLKRMPSNAVMLELGSYWAFYSMWFNKVVSNAKNLMIEPDDRCLHCGEENFKLNNLRGSFYQYFIGSKEEKEKKVTTIDAFCIQQKIKHLDILHSDIQGYEYEMLLGAEQMLNNKEIDFLFVSTHSNELHNQCENFLKEKSYKILASVNLNQSFSIDGVLVASKFDLPKFNMHLK